MKKDSFEECLFDLTEDGDILMNYFKIPMSNSIPEIDFCFVSTEVLT